MFESIQPDSIPERLRNAAFPPMAAFLVAQLYFAIYPLFERVPAALFWSIDVILLAGVIAGVIAIVRVVRSAVIRGGAIGWLVVAILVELLCAWLFLAMTIPWR